MPTGSQAAEPATPTYKQPSWDGSVLTLHSFLHALETWLYFTNPSYKMLIEHGTTINVRGEIIVQSSDHMHRLITGNCQHTFDDPASPPSDSFTAYATAAIFAAASSAAASPAREASDHESAPSAEPPTRPSSPRTTAASAAAALGSGSVDSLSEEQTSALLANSDMKTRPAVIKVLDEAMFNHICGCFTTDALRQSARATHNSSGLKLLKSLGEKAKGINAKVGAANETKLLRHIRTGISEISPSAFQTFRNELDLLRTAIPNSLRPSDAIVAPKVARAAEKLLEGDHKLTMRLSNEFTNKNAEYDLEKTCEAIMSVLEAKAIDDANDDDDHGSALNGKGSSDPRFNQEGDGRGRGGGGRGRGRGEGSRGAGGRGGRGDGRGTGRGNVPWTPAMGNCRHCSQDGHRHKDCPHRAAINAALKAKEAAPATAAAKAAAAAKDQTDKITKLESELAAAKALVASGSPAPAEAPTGQVLMAPGKATDVSIENLADDSNFVLTQLLLEQTLASMEPASGHARMASGADSAPVADPATDGDYECRSASSSPPPLHEEPDPETHEDTYSDSVHLPMTAKFSTYSASGEAIFIDADDGQVLAVSAEQARRVDYTFDFDLPPEDGDSTGLKPSRQRHPPQTPPADPTPTMAPLSELKPSEWPMWLAGAESKAARPERTQPQTSAGKAVGATPSMRVGIYVIRKGDEAGISCGTWYAPDNLCRYGGFTNTSSGITHSRSYPIARKATTGCHAAAMCTTLSPPVISTTVPDVKFLGPRPLWAAGLLSSDNQLVGEGYFDVVNREMPLLQRLTTADLIHESKLLHKMPDAFSVQHRSEVEAEINRRMCIDPTLLSLRGDYEHAVQKQTEVFVPFADRVLDRLVDLMHVELATQARIGQGEMPAKLKTPEYYLHPWDDDAAAGADTAEPEEELAPSTHRLASPSHLALPAPPSPISQPSTPAVPQPTPISPPAATPDKPQPAPAPTPVPPKDPSAPAPPPASSTPVGVAVPVQPAPTSPAQVTTALLAVCATALSAIAVQLSREPGASPSHRSLAWVLTFLCLMGPTLLSRRGGSAHGTAGRTSSPSQANTSPGGRGTIEPTPPSAPRSIGHFLFSWLFRRRRPTAGDAGLFQRARRDCQHRLRLDLQSNTPLLFTARLPYALTQLGVLLFFEWGGAALQLRHPDGAHDGNHRTLFARPPCSPPPLNPVLPPTAALRLTRDILTTPALGYLASVRHCCRHVYCSHVHHTVSLAASSPVAATAGLFSLLLFTTLHSLGSGTARASRYLYSHYHSRRARATRVVATSVSHVTGATHCAASSLGGGICDFDFNFNHDRAPLVNLTHSNDNALHWVHPTQPLTPHGDIATSPPPLGTWTRAPPPIPPNLAAPPSPPPVNRHGHALLRHASPAVKASPGSTSGPSNRVTTALRQAKALLGRSAGHFVRLVLDSGCTWHAHYRREDLVNLRPCSDTFTDASGNKSVCAEMGDLPVVVLDSERKPRIITIKDVRLVPTFDATLISVHQLEEQRQCEVRFYNIRSLFMHDSTGPVQIPFQWRDGLFILTGTRVTAAHRTLPRHSTSPSSGSIKLAPAADDAITSTFDSPPEDKVTSTKASTVHSSHSRSHVSSLPADEAAQLMHNRLHVGVEKLRNLATHSSDAPPSLSRARQITCEDCAVANATHLSHTSDRYVPSHVGRLIHADIAGPFRLSRTGFRYLLVLVDDHSRWKSVYFLKRKSDAPDRIKSFIASFNALASLGKDSPVRVVGSFHTDNAGEFTSHEFESFLDKELIALTTSAPHVHQLNGVAERAIRSIFNLVRSQLEWSNAPISFWDYAVAHAVDVLNRTSGPPGSKQSAFELVTGNLPRIMHIMPFGCRAIAVRPSPSVVKSEFMAHAQRGINLGRSSQSPGAYHVWVPRDGKVVTTSDVYFVETHRPWHDVRAEASARPPPALPTAVPEGAPQPPGLLDVPASEKPSTPSLPDALSGQVGRSTPETSGRAAGRSRKVLVLFSGPMRRRDGLAVYLRSLGLEPELVDNDRSHGGGAHLDLLNDGFYRDLLSRVSGGEYLCVIAAPPCSTYSVSRFFSSSSRVDGGAPVVRTRDPKQRDGLHHVPISHRRELEEANELTRRTCSLLGTAAKNGTQFILENPADHGDPTQKHLFIHPDHCPIWLTHSVEHLKASTGASTATFPFCHFGADVQKYTTLMYSVGFAPHLDALDRLRCRHAKHSERAGGTANEDGWNSRSHAAYPAELNLFLATACGRLANTWPVPPALQASRHDASLLPVRHPAGPPADAEATPPTASGPPGSSETSPPSATSHEDDTPPPPEPSPPGESPSDDEEDVLLGVTGDAPPEPIDANWQRNGRGLGRPSTRSRVTSHNVPLASGLRASSTGTAALAMLAVLGSATGTSDVESIYTGAHAVRMDRPWAEPSCGMSLLAKRGAGDPANHREAMLDDAKGWGESERLELENHRSNQSYVPMSIRDVPHGRRLVNFTWAYKRKRDGRKKSRLCVQGCTMVAGVDYDQTFSATMRAGSLRVLSSLAAAHNLHMRRWDFVAAYLQGKLEPGEVVYCRPPPGHPDPPAGCSIPAKDLVYRVVKPIYGMSQAGRRWQRTLFPWMTSQGFTQLHADPCLFIKREGKDVLIVGCYVDDLFCLSASQANGSLYSKFTSSLISSFEVEDEGEISDLLNVEIVRHRDSVVLKQSGYINRMVDTYLPDGLPPRSQANRTPCAKELPDMVAEALGQPPCTDTAAVRRYQSLVGALLYCSTHTRPDVAYAVAMLCRCMARPTPALYDAALRVLCYLHHHRDVGLRYTATDDELRGMSDADWAVKHSTTGWVFRHMNAAVSWASRKQSSVALSTCEAEIVALSEAAKESVHLAGLLDELGFGSKQPVPLSTDNTGAHALAYNPAHHERVKHVHRRHFYVRELVESFRVNVQFVRTTDNLADFFTKPLEAKPFFALRNVIMNVSRSAQNASGVPASASGPVHGGVLRTERCASPTSVLSMTGGTEGESKLSQSCTADYVGSALAAYCSCP